MATRYRTASGRGCVKTRLSGDKWIKLTAEVAEFFAEVAEKGVLCVPLRIPRRPLRFKSTLLTIHRESSHSPGSVPWYFSSVDDKSFIYELARPKSSGGNER